MIIESTTKIEFSDLELLALFGFLKEVKHNINTGEHVDNAIKKIERACVFVLDDYSYLLEKKHAKQNRYSR